MSFRLSSLFYSIFAALVLHVQYRSFSYMGATQPPEPWQETLSVLGGLPKRVVSHFQSAISSGGFWLWSFSFLDIQLSPLPASPPQRRFQSQLDSQLHSQLHCADQDSSTTTASRSSLLALKPHSRLKVRSSESTGATVEGNVTLSSLDFYLPPSYLWSRSQMDEKLRDKMYGRMAGVRLALVKTRTA